MPSMRRTTTPRQRRDTTTTPPDKKDDGEEQQQQSNHSSRSRSRTLRIRRSQHREDTGSPPPRISTLQTERTDTSRFANGEWTTTSTLFSVDAGDGTTKPFVEEVNSPFHFLYQPHVSKHVIYRVMSPVLRSFSERADTERPSLGTGSDMLQRTENQSRERARSWRSARYPQVSRQMHFPQNKM